MVSSFFFFLIFIDLKILKIFRNTRFWLSAKFGRWHPQDLHHSARSQVAEQRGDCANNESSDGSNWLETRRHQIPSQRALPWRARVRQSVDVSTGTGAERARRWQNCDEELLERHAWVQIWHQRQVDCGDSRQAVWKLEQIINRHRWYPISSMCQT